MSMKTLQDFLVEDARKEGNMDVTVDEFVDEVSWALWRFAQPGVQVIDGSDVYSASSDLTSRQFVALQTLTLGFDLLRTRAQSAYKLAHQLAWADRVCREWHELTGHEGPIAALCDAAATFRNDWRRYGSWIDESGRSHLMQRLKEDAAFVTAVADEAARWHASTVTGIRALPPVDGDPDDLGTWTANVVRVRVTASDDDDIGIELEPLRKASLVRRPDLDPDYTYWRFQGVDQYWCFG